MPPRQPKPQSKKVESLKHTDDKRKHIPTAEFQSVMEEEEKSPVRVAYERRNRDLDPQLVWRGKDEQDWSDLVVSAPPLYIQEKIHPKVLIDDLRRQSAERVEETTDKQFDLFADFNGIPKDATGTEFYQHDANWTNRMILGDSLQVMASLAEREGLRGKVQCIYLDPPYGIKFNSNFQWSTTSRDVKDGKADQITREPEQVKAFRDTWRDGIHSYLTYLRDRLTVARDLLSESGSIFVQIGDENVHRVRSLMDEIFGADKFVSEIIFRKTTSSTSSTLSNVHDIIVWYRKGELAKFRRLFQEKDEDSGASAYKGIDNGKGSFTSSGLTSQNPGSRYLIRFEGKVYKAEPGWWKTGEDNMSRVLKADRIISTARSVRYKRYLADFPVFSIDNLWNNTAGDTDKFYVVQTAPEAVKRCILMATDPGDLVLDPTCVRRGTRVLCPLADHDSGSGSLPEFGEGWGGVQSVSGAVSSSPLNPPAHGGTLRTDPAHGGTLRTDPAHGGTLRTDPVHGGTLKVASTHSESPAPSPNSGKVGVGSVPIEQLQPGDRVIGHDGKSHTILRTIQKTYRGTMIGIRHAQTSQTLWVTADHRILCQKRNLSYGGDNSWKHIPPQHFDRSRHLRRNQTPAEQKLWQAIRGEKLGVKFRRQHPLGAYILDFYAHSKGCVIELDGETHDSPDAQAYDAARDAYLNSVGLKVLRFSNQDVYNNLEAVLTQIQQTLEHIEPGDLPQQEWRRADTLKIGDTIFCGIHQQPVEIIGLETETTEETVYDLEVADVHSFVTEVCTVHNCGSGTTAYVAEQWGRRWITIDTSRVALALARARIMGARYPFYLLADSPAGKQKEAEITHTLPSDAPTFGNIRQGFVYQRVPHITLKSIANNAEIDVIWDNYQTTLEPLRQALNTALGKTWEEWEIPREAEEFWSEEAKESHAHWWQQRIARQKEIDASIQAKADQEFLYDKPYEDKSIVRVAGPFTVESLSPHRVLVVDENDELVDPSQPTQRSQNSEVADFASIILENLKTSGVQQAHKEDKISFTSLTGWPGQYLCAEGRYLEGEGDSQNERRAGIFIGPEFGTVTDIDLVAAARETGDAGFDALIACAFSYDARSANRSKLGRINILKARMNADLHMANELKNTGTGNLFVIFGEPDIDITTVGDNHIQVKVNGVDVFRPRSGEVQSSGPDEIACWFIDTDYNEESFFVRHAYFLGASDPYKSLKTTLKAEIDEAAWESLYSDTSRPFDKPESGRIAVKVINHLGDEVMKVFSVE